MKSLWKNSLLNRCDNFHTNRQKALARALFLLYNDIIETRNTRFTEMTLNDLQYQEVVAQVEADFRELSLQEIKDLYSVPKGENLDYDELFDFCVNTEIENYYK